MYVYLNMFCNFYVSYNIDATYTSEPRRVN